MPHAIEKAAEKLGLSLTIEHLRYIARQCTGGAPALRGGTNGCRRHLVVVEGVLAVAVYDPRKGIIVTLYPPKEAVARMYGGKARYVASSVQAEATEEVTA